MTLRERITNTAALALVIAAVAIGSYAYGGAGQTWDSTGSNSPSVEAFSAATSTEGPLIVLVVTVTGTPTMIGQRSPTPYPTATLMPRCIQGEAIDGLACLAVGPTRTPGVRMPVAVFGSVPTVVGERYIWQRTGQEDSQ